MSGAPNPILETHQLYKAFGALVVVNGIDFCLKVGARHALIGPNGAGKTTFINLLSGTLSPITGRVCLGGRDITKLRPEQRVAQGLARTFQLNQLCKKLEVIENVALAIRERERQGAGLWRPAGRGSASYEEAADILERLNLGDEMLRPVAQLPYGRQRLVELAVAMALRPRVLLLDEPAAGVPRVEMGILLEALDSLPAEMAVLLIEHDMDIVLRYARRITVLVEGRVLVEGPPAEITCNHAVREAYLGVDSCA